MSHLRIFEMFKYFCIVTSTVCVIDVVVTPKIRN